MYCIHVEIFYGTLQLMHNSGGNANNFFLNIYLSDRFTEGTKLMHGSFSVLPSVIRSKFFLMSFNNFQIYFSIK